MFCALLVHSEEAKQFKAEKTQLLNRLNERESEIEQLNKR